MAHFELNIDLSWSVPLTLSTQGYWDVVISQGGGVLRTRTPGNGQIGPISKFFFTSLQGISLIQQMIFSKLFAIFWSHLIFLGLDKRLGSACDLFPQNLHFTAT